jgi:D-xylose transport system permease protein
MGVPVNTSQTNPSTAASADANHSLPQDAAARRSAGAQAHENRFARRLSQLYSIANAGNGLGPVVVSLVILASVFQGLDSHFLAAENLTNLMLQSSAIGVIAVGVVLVLLLGEIDLSVGAMSGVAGALLGQFYTQIHLNAGLAILLVLGMALAWGAFQGVIVTSFRLPAFVVTLAALITLEGIQLFLLGPTVTINFAYNGGVVKLTSTFFSPTISWIIAVATFAVFVAGRLVHLRRLQRGGLTVPSRAKLIALFSAVAVALFGATWIFNQDRGLPLAVTLFAGIVVGFDLIIRNTVYGRHIMAVGGDAEAARRTGVAVQQVRISVFAIGSCLAAFGGILAASRLLAATGSAGSGDVLIDAIAAAVIGGTSLFGGRGTVYSALLGILVIGSISNGMDLLSLSPSVKLIVTGLVLALAVISDAVVRRSGTASR